MKGDIAFFINSDKPNANLVVDQLVKNAQSMGYGCYQVRSLSEPYPSPLFVVAVGGDGTVLKSVPFAMRFDVPILGVNTGRIGFLSEVPPEGFVPALKKYADNALLIEQRMMLSCSVNGVDVGVCLNDILLYKETFSGVTQITYYIDDDLAGTVFCDGIVIGTPTGATGYSISAGGPIIAPGLNACVITPICSHSLLARPIVAPCNALLTFSMHSPGCLYADGQQIIDIGLYDTIEICRAEKEVRFLRMSKHNLFSLIREKLM